MKLICSYITVQSSGLFELVVEVYLPSSSHQRLPGLCNIRWVDRHTCLEVFLEMYEVFVTFLDAIIAPHEYTNLSSNTGSSDWDRDTGVRAQGMKAALSSFQTVAVSITIKNILDTVKHLAVKLKNVIKIYLMPTRWLMNSFKLSRLTGRLLTPSSVYGIVRSSNLERA